MIGIFDSGLGGIPIWKEIISLLPDEDYIYVADQAFLPYGDKTSKQITERARKITRFLVKKGSMTVVVACNTATINSIEALRWEFPNVNFVGVEPAVKPAMIMRQKKVLVLGTWATLSSDKFGKALEKFGLSGARLMSLPDWVERVEKGQRLRMRKEQSQAIESSEVVILACTHYLFFLDELRELYPYKVFLEPSKAVANRTVELHQKGISNSSIEMVTTGVIGKNEKRMKRLLGFEVKVESREI